MKIQGFYLFISCFAVTFLGYAQTDLPTQKPLKIEPANKVDPSGKTSKGTSLNIPSVLDDKPEINLEDPRQNQVNMAYGQDLKQAGHDLKIDPKVGPYKGEGRAYERFGDMYLGDLKSSAKIVGVVCRDHEYVDGDRIKIMHNGQVVDYNMMLTANFEGVKVHLESGFNRLDFVALNEGSSSPNTAQVDVYDDQGQLIYSNKWLLSKGSTATLIVTKE